MGNMDQTSLVRTPAKRADIASAELTSIFGDATTVPRKPVIPHSPNNTTKRDPRTEGRLAGAHAKLETEWPCRRFTPQDWMQWGNWMTDRLYQRFPEVPATTWLGRLAPYMSSNDAFFVCNDSSVLLANAFPRVPDGKEIILEAFALSRFAVSREDTMAIPHADYEKEKPLVALYQHCRDWGRERRAHRLFIGQNSDIWAQRLKEIMSEGKHCRWVGFAL